MPISQVALIALFIIGAIYLFLKLGRTLGVILVMLCVVLVAAFALVHSFTAFSSRTLVATVHASPVANTPHSMIVDMITYSADGTATTGSYELGGDLWMLQAQVVEFQPWILLTGMKSGYHLSRLSGQYSDSELGGKPIQLGSWSWFNSLENNVGLFSPVIKSAYSNAVIDPPGTYNVYADPQGDLSANRA